MEILFVTATLPYPLTDGTKIRIFSLITGLAVNHKVSVASFVTPRDRTDAIEHLRSYCKDVLVVPRSPRYSASKIVRGLVSPIPFPILNYWDPNMAVLIRGMVESTKFDIVQAETLQAAQYCAGIRPCRVLDLFDIQSVVMRRYAEQQSNVLKRIYAEITSHKLARYEKSVCPGFNHCLTASPDDQLFLQKQVGLKHVSIIPNGVDLNGYTPHVSQGIGHDRIVFVGRMDYSPNAEGVLWFCREVLPVVRAQRPDILFQIVGKDPTKEVKRLAIPGLIEVTGFVEDVRPYVGDATLCVVPLKVGGGTRLKILESLAMGKAVVSTSVGAEGIMVTPEQNILIADDASGFARQVARLLGDSRLRTSLGRAGRELVERYYSWNRIGRLLEELYERILREPKTSSGHS